MEHQLPILAKDTGPNPMRAALSTTNGENSRAYGNLVRSFALSLAATSLAEFNQQHNTIEMKERDMTTITLKDGTQIYYKDWGPKNAQPIAFHHGWPLSSDDWDAQMLFFLANGYRVVAHDRRGHGRSSQVDTGHDMDHYASDASAVFEHLDLRNAIHVGHSTGWRRGGALCCEVRRASGPCSQGRAYRRRSPADGQD